MQDQMDTFTFPAARPPHGCETATGAGWRDGGREAGGLIHGMNGVLMRTQTGTQRTPGNSDAGTEANVAVFIWRFSIFSILLAFRYPALLANLFFFFFLLLLGFS